MDSFKPLAGLNGGRHPSTALQLARGVGGGFERSRSSAGRSRSRGSVFAAHAGVSPPSRTWLTPITGRGGEVLTLRSMAFTWPLPLSGVPAGSCPPQNSQSTPQTPALHTSISKTTSPLAPLSETDGNARTAQAQGACADTWAAKEDIPAAGKTRPSHRRRVTWAGTVETREVARTPPCQVFSPDLHALEIAQKLAIVADEPGVAQAAQAVMAARRQVAAVVRSLSASNAWSGSLEGVEDQWRMWSRREFLFLRETDELVRCVVSSGREGDADGNGSDNRTVYRLKAAYRAARRRMDDADAE